MKQSGIELSRRRNCGGGDVLARNKPFFITLWSLDIILVELKEEEKRKHCFLDILSVGSYNVTIQGQNISLSATESIKNSDRI